MPRSGFTPRFWPGDLNRRDPAPHSVRRQTGAAVGIDVDSCLLVIDRKRRQARSKQQAVSARDRPGERRCSRRPHHAARRAHGPRRRGRRPDHFSQTAPERHGTTPASAASDRRLLIVLGLASFLAVVNFAAPSPFFPEIARDLGTTVPRLGQVTTILTLLSAILGLGVGPLADRYGHRRLMVGGVVAIAVNLLGTGLAPTYPLLLLLAVVGGLGDAVLFGLPLAIAATHFTGEARRRAVSWTSAGVPLGTVVGVPLLAAAGGIAGWRGVLAGVGVATLGAAWLVATWLPAEVSRRQERFRVRSLLDAYRPLLHHPPTLVLYAVSGLRAAGWVGMLTYLGAFLTDTFRFGPGRVGLAYMAAGAGAFLGSLAAAGRLGRPPPRPLAAAATAVQGLLFGAVFVLPLSALAAVSLLPLAAFGGTIAFVGVVTLLADETPGGAATTMVLNGSVFNLGTATGAALGGLLIALGGYGALGIGLPFFALVASLLALLHERPRRPAHEGRASPEDFETRS